MTKWPIDKLKGATFCNDVCMNVNEFGIKEPIDVLPDGTVVDGKKRLAAARCLKYAVVPVNVLKDITPPVDSRIIAPADVKLYDFVKMDTCGTRLYLKVDTFTYLELQEGCDPIPYNQAVVDWQEFRTPISTILAFEDKIVRHSKMSYDGIYTTVISQYSKPANHFKRYDVVRLYGGNHPYLIYSISTEEIFLRSLVSGVKKTFPIASSKLYTKQVIAQAEIV